jgi:hypothetical protein
MLAGLSSASAQTTGAPTRRLDRASIETVRTDYRIHAGPFHVNPACCSRNWAWTPTCSTHAGEQKSDFTFTVTPQADIAVAFARRGFAATTVGTDVVLLRDLRQRALASIVGAPCAARRLRAG